MSSRHQTPAVASHKGRFLTLAGYLGYFVIVSVLGFLLSLAWNKRQWINELFFAANLQRYLTQSGEVGPVTYLVYHNDYAALEAMARENEDILGIEVYEFPAIAAMAFTSGGAASIEAVRKQSTVSGMTQRQIPMICH